MKQKQPKLKGLKAPKLCVFLHGFLNGRMNTAGIDGGQGHLTSAHIHSQLHRFSEYCQKRLAKMEQETWELRTEARTLIPELRALACPSLPPERVNSGTGRFPQTVDEAQSSRTAAAAEAKHEETRAGAKQLRDDVLARRTWIIRRLIKIREQLTLSERLCAEELSATAHALQSRFCTYGHGVLLKPLCAGHIPEIEFESFLADHHIDCEALRQQITAVLEEEV